MTHYSELEEITEESRNNLAHSLLKDREQWNAYKEVYFDIKNSSI